MGFHQTVRYLFLIILFLLFLLLLLIPYSASSSLSLSHEIQPQYPSAESLAAQYHHYQVFYVKNTNPFFLNKQEPTNKTKQMKKNKNMKRQKKIKENYHRAGPFSVMLPKGFVPPSGSSPCHNENPKLVPFYCHKATKP
ncbi:putative Nuclear receptor coactivator 6 [Quillaja saponaria]|uniref:Nuclear receptor coactivator 6 n=1 Tax=Quillaja saponaria TaxID=32244 RepID=A0AAD7PA38_QUISA|nr:putative Nuclear receptor coactivator 6 [Quillaja saponaria]